MLKAFVALSFLLIAGSAESQREKAFGDQYSQLSVDAINVATGEQLDTFEVIVSSILGSFRFGVQGAQAQLIVLDSSEVYTVKVKKNGLSIAEYSWNYSAEENDYRRLHVRLYPEGFTPRQRRRTLKRYQRALKRSDIDRTCKGLHWVRDVYI